MDDFVRNKLTEWKLSDWIDAFEAQEIDEESLYHLNDQEIDQLITKAGPRVKFKEKLKMLKEEQNTTQPQKEAVNTSGQDFPSISERGKRKSDHLQSETRKWQPPLKKQYNCAARSQSETEILSDVKNIMRCVSEGLHGRDKLSAFLKDKIKNLETERRHLVGVFGKTGAGKSSLINAIINKEGLLPSGSVSACTSVMIKVEATNGSKYEAHIEFITKEDWEDEVQSLKQALEDNDDNDDDDGGNDDLLDPDGKLSALYGEEWKERSTHSLMDNKYFIDIPEFRTSKIKILKSDSVGEVEVKCSEKSILGRSVRPVCKLQWVQKKIKNAVKNEFKKRKTITNHFSEHCFKVFTVSSKEFLKGENVNSDVNEILKLKEILKNLNDAHSETLNYVSGAHGILSLIQGARSGEVVEQKNDVFAILEGNLSIQLNQVKKAIEDIIKAFEQCLSEGVEKSKKACEKKLKSFLYPSKKTNRAFHMTLKSAVRNDGIQKPKKGKPKNLNMILASYLTESIDEKFRDTFPNNIKCGHFNGAIDAFSLSTDSLIEKYKDVKLQLTFLQTEGEKMKTKLNKTILTQKKLIYNSLTETIKDNMKECYKEAAAFTGKGTLKNMRDTIERHVHSKMDMFEEAKNVMLELLNDLKETVLRTLEKTMKDSIEHSLKSEACSLPGKQNI
ncbi:nuclear GTPase SLIP-GC-like [Neolamprologus brichardi]|uniref:nuclear GTPase SLIP-GC-like n=1 Tax=Neolamprologus brichardi TaxID=32507 RepID=UPI001643E14F|nr:nuclear GTPase SLIP-GC-like [Neolamprologus brichardi]